MLGAWPFVEQWITGDKREHHLLERPRNAPVRTALGVAGMTCYGVLWIGGGNDIIAVKFNLDIYDITWFVRIGTFVLPILAFIITKRICIGLQRADANRILHGYETGIIERTPDGGYSERHAPLSVPSQFVLTTHDRLPVLEAPQDGRRQRCARARTAARRSCAPGSGSSTTTAPSTSRPTHDVEHAAEHLAEHNGHPVALGEDFQGVSETGVPRVTEPASAREQRGTSSVRGTPGARRNALDLAAFARGSLRRHSAEPAFQSSQGTFQSVQPFWSSMPRGLLMNFTTSPRLEFWYSQLAFAVLMPVQPWLTFARPCDAADQGAACRNSPELVTRMAHLTSEMS